MRSQAKLHTWPQNCRDSWPTFKKSYLIRGNEDSTRPCDVAELEKIYLKTFRTMSRNATFTFSILFECHVLDSTSYITLKKKTGKALLLSSEQLLQPWLAIKACFSDSLHLDRNKHPDLKGGSSSPAPLSVCLSKNGWRSHISFLLFVPHCLLFL